MNSYFSEIIAERRVRPKDDLLSQLVAVEENDRLTEAEVIANCSLLLSAGHETTSNLIGNGLLSLLRHPDQLRYATSPKSQPFCHQPWRSYSVSTARFRLRLVPRPPTSRLQEFQSARASV